MAELKIRDLQFDEAKKISRTDGDLPVSEWYQKVCGMKNINKPYQKLIDKIMQDAPELLGVSNDDPLEPWKDTLMSTPISKLVYFAIDRRDTQLFEKTMPERGIKTLWDLHKWTKGSGPQKRYIEDFMRYKDILENKCSELLGRITDIEKEYCIPAHYNEDDSLYGNIKQAMAELVELKIDNKPVKLGNDTLTQVIYSHFVEKLPWADVVKKMGKEDFYLKKIERDFVVDLLHGNKIKGNIILNTKIVNKFLYFEENCAFELVDKMLPTVGNVEPELLNLVKYDLIELKEGIWFIIPNNSKGIYSEVGRVILNILNNNAVVPIQKDDIIDMIEDELSINKIDYDERFVDNVLMCDKIVDVLSNEMIQITDSLLDDTKRVVRLLYQNAPKQYDKKQLEALFEDSYHRVPLYTYSRLSEFGVSCVGLKWYYGIPMEPIKNKIEQFALENKHFKYEDLRKYLISENYAIPKSIRRKITEICQVDTKDSMHFCHKDFVDEYSPEYTWRKTSITGLTNWILNQANDCLQGKDSALLDDVIDYTEEQAKNTENEFRIRERCRYCLKMYSGDDRPFLIDGSLFKRNPVCYDNTDFETIGRRGNYPFYKQIRSLIAYEIKKTQDGRMLLTEAVRLAENSFGVDNVDRNTVERALTNRYLQPIDIELISEKGNRYVVWTTLDVKVEPTYQVTVSQSSQDVEIVQQVVDPQPRRSIRYREEVDWIKLSDSLKSELHFYDTWMRYEGYSIENGVDKFLAFIKESSNPNLCRVLPQNLYEYWFAGTDAFDRENYVRNLSIFYEALLADIYYRKYDKKLHKKGLYDWADEFEMAHKISFYNNSKGFDRILTNLYRMRNKLAHGDAVELSSRDTANTIADYVALYVYTMVKYYD